MTEPARNPGDAAFQRLLTELNAQSGSLSSDDLLRLQEFVQRVGGIEAARELLETLGDILPEDGAAEIDLEAIDLEEIDFEEDEDADDDLDQVAA